MDKLSEKKYYVGVDENDKKLYYTPAEICEELGDDIEALEKERDEYKGVMLHIDEQINSRRNYIPKWLRDRITAVLTGNL